MNLETTKKYYFNSEQELKTIAKQYRECGYEVLPYDEPCELVKKYICFQEIEKPKEKLIFISANKNASKEAIELCFEVVPKVHVIDTIEVTDAKVFKEKFEKYKNFSHFYRCDQPKQCKLGFVVFDQTNNVIKSFICNMIKVKELNDNKFIEELLATKLLQVTEQF